MSAHSSSAPHVMPIKIYLGVFATLLVLTGLTVFVSYMNLGPAAIFVAMAVAMVKAGLVVSFFMHLKYEDKFLALIFASSLVFLAIFFGFTFLDFDSRGAVISSQETLALEHEKEQLDMYKLREQRRAEAADTAKKATPPAAPPVVPAAPEATAPAAAAEPAPAPGGH